MKYSSSEYITEAFYRDMKRHISDLKKKTGTKYAIHPTLVTTYGVVDNAYSKEILAIITSDELFSL